MVRALAVVKARSKAWARGGTVNRQGLVAAYGIVLVLAVIGEVIRHSFLGSTNVFSELTVASFFGLVGVGQTFVILTGGIDLSIPYVLNGAAVLSTGLVATFGAGAWWTIVVALAACALVGLVNGVGVAYLNMNPLIMTLGMNTVLEGVILVWTNGTPTGAPSTVALRVMDGHWGPVPTELVLWAVVAILIGAVLSRTVFGRHLYAVGNSNLASFLVGVKVPRTVALVYVISAVFAGVAGILLAAFSGTSFLGMGDAYQLPSIALVVLGGASILGGSGNYWGSIAGALILTVLSTLLTVMNMPAYVVDILYGVVILVALIAYNAASKSERVST